MWEVEKEREIVEEFKEFGALLLLLLLLLRFILPLSEAASCTILLRRELIKEVVGSEGNTVVGESGSAIFLRGSKATGKHSEQIRTRKRTKAEERRGIGGKD